MRSKHSIFIGFLLFFILNFCIEGYSQKIITYKAENQPLNIVLSKVSAIANVRFAFDNDFFSKVPVSINVKGVTVEQFLNQLSLKYPVTYRLIGSTWVVYKDEKIATVKTKPKVEEHKKPSEPEPVKNKTEYKVARLWYLKGVIVDSKTGNRLRNCKLYIDEYTQPETNDLCFFSDEVVGTGEIRADVNYWGYNPLDTLFTASDEKDIVIQLTPILKGGIYDNDDYSENPVHFQGRTNTLSVYGRNGMIRAGKDVTDFSNSFKFIPGIDLNTSTQNGIEISGGYTTTFNVLVDEIPVFNQTHLFGQISTINNDYVYQNYLSRGGLSADQGVNTSGLLELIGKNGFGKPSLMVTTSLIDASLSVGIPLSKKISFSGAVRKSIGDYWPNYYYKNQTSSSLSFQSVDGTKGTISEANSSFYDINTKLTWHPNIRNEVNLIFNRSFDKQSLNCQLSSDSKYFLNKGSDWQTNSMGLTWKFISKNNWNHSFVGSFSYLGQNKQNNSGSSKGEGDIGNVTISDFDSTKLSIIQLKWKTEYFAGNFSHLIGAEFTNLSLDHEYNKHYYLFNEHLSYSDESIVNNNSTSQANLFYQLKYNPVNWMELQTGIRGLYDFRLQRFYPQPRISLDIYPQKQLKLFYRFGEEITTLYKTQRYNWAFIPESDWVMPNESNHIINSWQHIIGGIFEHNGLLVNLEAYRSDEAGKSSYFQYFTTTDQNLENIYRFTEGSQIRQGIDFMLHYQHAVFNHSLSYSYCDLKENYLLINSNNYFSSPNQRHHQIKLTEMIRYSGWTAIASFKYCSKSPYIIVGSSNEGLSFSYLPGNLNFDFSVVKEIELKKVKLETGISLLNILNNHTTENIEYYRINGTNENLLENTTQNLLVNTTRSMASFAPSFFVSIKFD
jgi:hypothetical protein